jgi:hypothetical protein
MAASLPFFEKTLRRLSLSADAVKARSCAEESKSNPEPVLEWLLAPTACILTSVTDGFAKYDEEGGAPVGDFTDGVDGTDTLATLVAFDDILDD